MTYTVAAGLGVAGALALDVAVLRTRLVRRRVFWATYPIVAVFQLIFNGILTSRGVVRYDPAAIIGVRVAGAPIEDLAFGLALVLATLSVWIWWERVAVSRTAGSRPTPDWSASARRRRRGRPWPAWRGRTRSARRCAVRCDRARPNSR